MHLKYFDNHIKKKDKSKSVIGAYAIGTFIGELFFVLAMALVSLVLYETKSNSEILYYLPYLFIFLGSFITAVYCYKHIGGRGFLTGIISSFPYSFIIVILCAIILEFSVTAKLLLVVPISLLGGFSGGVMAVNKKI